jgi:hypothetical protein
MFFKLLLLIGVSHLVIGANLSKMNDQLKACNSKCAKYKDSASGNNEITKVRRILKYVYRSSGPVLGLDLD